MEPTKYANMDSARSHEESAPLLDLEQMPAGRASEDTNPFVDDPLAADDASSKESHRDSVSYASRPNAATAPTTPAPAPTQSVRVDRASNDRAGGLPLPATAWVSSDQTAQVLMLLPKIILSIMWFVLLCMWGGISIFYLVCWLLLQIFTGFTRVQTDKKMVRRDLGGFFDALMDLFEKIW